MSNAVEKVLITIETNNAAFEHDLELELRLILEELTKKLRTRTVRQLDKSKLLDSNGNAVGRVTVLPFTN